jgi:hypothetical protein
MEGRERRENSKKKIKGRSFDWVVNWEATVGDHPVSAYDALPKNKWAFGESDRSVLLDFVLTSRE